MSVVVRASFEYICYTTLNFLQTWANLVATEHPILTIPTNVLFSKTDSHPIQQMTWHGFGFGQESDLVTLGHTLFPGWLPFDKIGLVKFVSFEYLQLLLVHSIRLPGIECWGRGIILIEY